MKTSVNNVTYHDGFTLHDMVSYSQKHNLANLEDNYDGHNHNLSDNYGVEGETTDTVILALREKQKRNLFSTLILSQGTPHILGGDELSRSQKGNNNAYCQDNELNWLNWELDASQSAFLAFSQYVIALRKNNPLLSRMMFEDDQFNNEVNIETTDWYRIDGTFKRDQDWTNDSHHCFALHLVGHTSSFGDMSDVVFQEWLYIVNSSTENVEFNLPLLLNTQDWECVLNTALSEVAQYSSEKVSPLLMMESRSFCLLKLKA
jgi:glycogen operon protein